MGILEDDDYGSGDDLFDQVTEDDLVQLSTNPSEKRPREGETEEGPEVSVKKLRQDSAASNGDQSRLRLAEKILVENFGYQSFRHEQGAAINRILNGQNALVVFPTGAGKSLCYQVPAIAFEELDRQDNTRQQGKSGITIVVSPLIALMKDQVDALKKKGISAELMASTSDWQEMQRINDSIRRGQCRLLYCAPERLNNEGFVEMMKTVNGGVRLVGVDEAHCISEWGHSFRPDYLKVARFVEEIKAERVICLTATATPIVAEDICKAFQISADGVYRTTPYRPNLRLEAKIVEKKDDKYDLLLDFLRNHRGSTLIYVTQQKQAEELARYIQTKGLSAKFFHAGMKPEEKKNVQDDFMSSKIRTVVATIAFGMGIDKSDLRNVLHWDLPSTVEEYCQQVGRAGRDGKDSYCLLYLCPEDYYVKENFARGDIPSQRSVYNLLENLFLDQNRGLEPGDTFKVSHYSQSSDFDIRPTTLSIIYAALELRFNLIRATTPEYSSYKFEATPNYVPRLKQLNSPEAKAVLENAKKAKLYHAIDLSSVAQRTGLRRTDLVRLLNELNGAGVIKLNVSGVEHKYKVLKSLPSSVKEIKTLTEQLYEDMKYREKQALERIQQVVDFITGNQCFALSIAKHFGTNLPDGKEKCGHCTFCFSGQPLHLPVVEPKPIDKGKIKQILAATDVRDDPLFLARVAFGITSPRARSLKLQNGPVFGLMADYGFEDILKEFEKACATSGK